MRLFGKRSNWIKISLSSSWSIWIGPNSRVEHPIPQRSDIPGDGAMEGAATAKEHLSAPAAREASRLLLRAAAEPVALPALLSVNFHDWKSTFLQF